MVQGNHEGPESTNTMLRWRLITLAFSVLCKTQPCSPIFLSSDATHTGLSVPVLLYCDESYFVNMRCVHECLWPCHHFFKLTYFASQSKKTTSCWKRFADIWRQGEQVSPFFHRTFTFTFPLTGFIRTKWYGDPYGIYNNLKA